jgi:hypothetical protein
MELQKSLTPVSNSCKISIAKLNNNDLDELLQFFYVFFGVDFYDKKQRYFAIGKMVFEKCKNELDTSEDLRKRIELFAANYTDSVFNFRPAHFFQYPLPKQQQNYLPPAIKEEDLVTSKTIKQVYAEYQKKWEAEGLKLITNVPTHKRNNYPKRQELVELIDKNIK